MIGSDLIPLQLRNAVSASAKPTRVDQSLKVAGLFAGLFGSSIYHNLAYSMFYEAKLNPARGASKINDFLNSSLDPMRARVGTVLANRLPRDRGELVGCQAIVIGQDSQGMPR
jgi:hypothetical protein